MSEADPTLAPERPRTAAPARLAAAVSRAAPAATAILPRPAPAVAARERPTDDAADPAAQALQLYATLAGAATLTEAAHRLAASLARLSAAGRVSVGLRERQATKLLASTALDARHAAAELPSLLRAAMDEAMDQAAALTVPAAEPAAAGPIRIAHEALARAGEGAVATLPLGRDGQALLAVCLERRADKPFSPPELAALQDLLQLAQPLLVLWQRAELSAPRRAWLATCGALAALRQPRARTRRRALALAAAVLAFVALAPLAHEVGGRARVEGAVQRLLVAPSDGFVKAVHARPGDVVRDGATLVELMEQDLQLERGRWASQVAQHENAYAAAMARADRAQAAVALARAGEAQAQLALLDGELGRSRIVAPFDGVVIDGDLSRSIGAPVRQGDALVTVAVGASYRVVGEIDESEIGRVRAGQRGTLMVSALGFGGHAVEVERIAPLARAVDGRNVFEVQARLLDDAPGLRPGLLGRIEIEVGRRPPLWVWAARAADRLRLAWWRLL
ncbi:MAG: HlyD family efflux transporter periplasmic adaptor subunit [Burkholderiales bacterium]|nr:HlyD family efflux transporter periplasmic adaptor subunit [Burkholderiales bacterium]